MDGMFEHEPGAGRIGVPTGNFIAQVAQSDACDHLFTPNLAHGACSAT